METGASLGPYRIDRELGSGGMGRVYAATVGRQVAGLAPGTVVALKVVHPHLLETEGFFKRFLREAQIGQSVLHENVVRTLDCDAVGGHHFLVMEYVEGQTLHDLQRELDRVPEELCRHVAREICNGLEAIHAAGVVHRDIKPENVLITPEHVVKVMDLGVARLADEALRLSQSGAFIGSVEYAAPEQFGGEVDHRADLHSLGLLLYELSCGQHPYRGDSFPEVMKRIREDAPRRLGEVHPQLSPFFEEVVHTLLAKDADERFASAAELLGVLVDGEGSTWWHERASILRAATKRPLRRIRIPRETAVYGRDAELGRLRALFERAKAGDGQVVLIEGEAGIGKSRLIDELAGRLQADGEDLNFLFGSYPPGGAATAAGAFSTAFREHFGDVGSAQYLPQNPLLVPAFDAVLRGEPSPPAAQTLNQESLATCFGNATRALAAERPTVILIDDLHFAPRDGCALFASLALTSPDCRVLLIGTMRPGVPEDWRANLTRLEAVSQFVLDRLGPKNLVELLRDSFRSDALAEQLGVQIAMKSDGNPFFAFEIIRGLREGQFITQQDDGTWTGSKVIDDIEIPSSVLDLVNARVADLDEAQRDVLDVASCWGYEFDPVLIGAVCGLGRVPALKRCGHIEHKHRLVRSIGRRYVFDHHQVQEALYQGLNEQLREEYHAALAEELETRTRAGTEDPEALDGELCVVLCDHFLKGRRDERALRYFPAARAHLDQGHLPAQMADLTERVLAAPGLLVGVARGRALLRLADAYETMGLRTRQEECALEVQRLADETADDALLVSAARGMGNLLLCTSRYPEAEEAYGRARDLAAALGDLNNEAGATGALGIIHYHQSRFEQAEEHWRRQLEVSRASGNRQAEAAATVNLGNVYDATGQLDAAEEQYLRGLALSREIGNRQFEANALGNLAFALSRRGRTDEAKRYAESQYTLSREIGFRRGELSALGYLGDILRQDGLLLEAQETHERQLALSRAIGDRRRETHAWGNLSLVAHSMGNLRAAERHCDRQLELTQEIGYRAGEAHANLNLAYVLRDSSEPERAAQCLRACLGACEEIGGKRIPALAHLTLGSLQVAADELDSGRESLTAAQEMAADQGMAGVETVARCRLACLPGGDPADALAVFASREDELSDDDRKQARHLLWKATGDSAHLAAAKRELDVALGLVDDETRVSMLGNVQVNREIMAAWTEHCGGDATG